MTQLETDKLNKNEILVLIAVIESHANAGGDFTYADEVHDEIKDTFSFNQVKGYLSQLTQKGFITICEDFEQINLLDSVYEIFPKLDKENYCSVYGENGNI